MAPVKAQHTLSLRGEAQPHRVRAEILDKGVVVGRSQWILVAPAASAQVTVDLTAEPGVYSARQATNVGSNVHEDIVTIDLGAIDHP